MQAQLPRIVSVGIYNSQLAHKTAYSPNRKTTMFELELPLDDSAVSYIDSEQRRTSADTVICAKPGQMRHSRLPYKCYYVHMIAGEGSLLEKLMQLPNFVEFPNPEPVTELFRAMCSHAAARTVESDVMVQSLVLQLVYLLLTAAPPAQRHKMKSNNHKAIEATLQYIADHLTEELTLETLARMASFSPVYFHKLFRTSTGKTLHRYIEEQRIKKSVDLLVTTDFTLSRIAYECGFSSQSYFSYAFKRSMGVTPRTYAKQIVERYHE